MYNGKKSYLHTITTPNRFVRYKQDTFILKKIVQSASSSIDISFQIFNLSNVVFYLTTSLYEELGIYRVSHKT